MTWATSYTFINIYRKKGGQSSATDSNKMKHEEGKSKAHHFLYIVESPYTKLPTVFIRIISLYHGKPIYTPKLPTVFIQ